MVVSSSGRTGDIVCRPGTNEMGSVISLPTGSPTVPGYICLAKCVRQSVFRTYPGVSFAPLPTIRCM